MTPTLRALPLLIALLPAVAWADAVFDRCLAGLQTQAAAKGVDAASFQRFTAGLAPDPSVLPLLDAQPEFTTPIWDYLASLVDSQRVSDGQAMLLTHRALLTRLSGQTGVDPATIVAVWGVESDYGRVTGKRPLLVSLATLSCAGRRQPFFRGELIALLGLLQQGDLSPEGLTGSWAGAFGQTQFMPSTYARIAVDGDGDGHRDLVASIPDALASTANYLVKAGWERARPWGMEVRLPPGFDASKAGRTRRQPFQAWQKSGLLGTDGQPLAPSGLPAETPAALLLPAGAAGPAFLVFRNYDAIYAYNAAESYALSIALLADRLRGGPGLAVAWPTDDPGLGRPERRALQQLLLARGHQIGEADGMVGSATRRAIQVEQTRLGLQPADGRPGQRILTALRAAPPLTGLAAVRGTAFKLPAAYPAFAQSPIVHKASPMSDTTGLTTGDFHGFPSLLIDTPFSTAAISLFGGQLLSFVPKGGQDVLWLSPSAKQPPTPIRGGAPVCWPYFGRQDQTGEVPAHGFVRTVQWQLIDSHREDDGSVVLTLAPPTFDDLALRLRMTLHIGRTVQQRLTTDNTSNAPVRFTQALHTYFRVGDALKVSVQGLDGLDYLDKYEHYATTYRQQGDWHLRDPRDPGRSDRIYVNAGGRYTLTDPVLARRIVIATEGSRSLVAWNPGEDAGKKMADVGEGWRDYVCLEAANAGPDVIDLAPGASHTLTQTISVE
ncbi:epimerase [Xanthomonas cucurbitae]|uniref:glucose-6-phosphate 1-epimerase n=1 Tax=Xanthomonas cucurbitae TaxID=56453 RepID=A0A2S7DRX3_9XANT|nr:lytic murein transglycosylase [Xanthomonas cucurbitae]PPU76588.1 epimerase [Xanthomonas cucurbitae]WDM79186.1 lytic murein transglycosylase [Xanthomonas cucurbitae]WDM82871.1 lytic murein transglycosylase [Xanthomonas cucurbitae]